MRRFLANPWAAWLWAWACVGREHAGRARYEQRFPWEVGGSREPFVHHGGPVPPGHTIHADIDIFGGPPTGYVGLYVDGESVFNGSREIAVALKKSFDAVAAMLNIGGFDRKWLMLTLEHVGTARRMFHSAPPAPLAGHHNRMAMVAWRLAMEQDGRTGAFRYRSWSEARDAAIAIALPDATAAEIADAIGTITPAAVKKARQRLRKKSRAPGGQVTRKKSPPRR
ncbi:MAG: hypothetical protein IPL61_12215 [Myxococcales bacterium]|nr:hypothetical protein [Myxococcales bacterium]